MSIQAERQNTQDETQVNAQNFLCQNCGGVIKYDIGSEQFRCSSCQTEYEVETLTNTVKEYDFGQYAQRESQAVAFQGRAVTHCQNCGGEIAFEEFQVAATCPMCASSQVATVKQAAGIPPDGIIPFKVDKDEARQKFRKWVKSRWFAPNDFKKKFGEGELLGMYLPFWTYDAAAVAAYHGRGGRNRTEKDKEGHTRTVTDWSNVSGVVDTTFDDVLVCATDREKQLRGILPFHTIENTKPYAPAYLSGYSAELYSIKADTGFETAKAKMEQELRDLARQDILRRFDRADVNTVLPRYSSVTYKHLLLPIWASAFGYKGKTFQYFVNGETGAVDGKRPYSAPKIIAAVLGVLAVLVLLFFFYNK